MIQAVPTSAASAATSNAQPAGSAKLKSAAQQFEAVFLRQMISSMRQAGPGDGMLDSEAGDTFRDMADASTADAMAHKGVLGLATLLEKQLAPAAAKGEAGKVTAPDTNKIEGAAK
jgi:peptidoglycan hydrolase FlgJ